MNFFKDFVSVEVDGDTITKTELVRHDLKRNSVSAEAEIIRDLNQKGCPCVPELLESGTNKNGQDYFVTRRIQGSTEAPTADIWLSYLAVRGCGWEHGDLFRKNTLHDGTTAWLVDFDQSFPSNDILGWKEGHSERELSQAFRTLTRQPFDLRLTSLAKRGFSTETADGIYHSIREQVSRGHSIFIDGERGVDGRIRTLSGIDFTGERVLDIGCNTGAISRHLVRTGGASFVHGLEYSPEHARLGQMVNCAAGMHGAVRIDQCKVGVDPLPPGGFATALLFSCLHHFDTLEDSARSIAGPTKRILIETRLRETGRFLSNGKWTTATKWNFADWTQLGRYLENLFPGLQAAERSPRRAG